MPRSNTNRLRNAMAAGANIICDHGEYKGLTVVYSPRHEHDALPWTILGTRVRMGGDACRAVHPDEI